MTAPKPKLNYTREEIEALLNAVGEYQQDLLKEKATAYALAEQKIESLVASFQEELNTAVRDADHLYSVYMDELEDQGFDTDDLRGLIPVMTEHFEDVDPTFVTILNALDVWLNMPENPFSFVASSAGISTPAFDAALEELRELETVNQGGAGGVDFNAPSIDFFNMIGSIAGSAR